MDSSQQHPIDGTDWHKAYPIPGSQPVQSVTPDELAAMMLADDAGAGPGKSYLIVDVRRSDCKSMIPTAVNFPAHSLPRSLPTLLALLQSSSPAGSSTSSTSRPLLLIFHCNSCKGRGPRSAAWVRDALEAQGKASKATAGGTDGGVQIQVAILEGGSDAWEKRFGARSVEERGFASWGSQTIRSEQDLRMVPL